MNNYKSQRKFRFLIQIQPRFNTLCKQGYHVAGHIHCNCKLGTQALLLLSPLRVISKGIEAFRLRPPGLVHYFHSKANMWGSHKNPNQGC